MKHLPIFVLGVLVSIGTYWSFDRGGHDFAVFFEAWRLVSHGQGSEIYQNSPDRFLYAPGFAWILSPLGFLPKTFALVLWSLGKAAAIYWMVQALASKLVELGESEETAGAIAAGGFILVARPLLIDLQYGQVNTFILAVCLWALLAFLSPKPSSKRIAVAWFFLGVVAVSKLFALPLLLLPFFRLRREGSNSAKLAGVSGVLFAGLIPAVTMGFSGTYSLMLAWREALIAKGLPFESHNQSFVAFLHHYFTVEPTHVISLGSTWVVLGDELLNLQRITELSFAWSFIFIGVLAAWILRPQKGESLRWAAIVIALLFVPSYLVWKPYFVLTYPLAVVLLWQYRSKKWLIGLGFIAMNLTGFDLIGGYWAARLEAASIFLIVHLVYLGLVLWGKPDFSVKTSSATL
jgi:hypothetical protein